ncbi:hypothetical protein FQN57_005366 [Myotisia sp. PD_48]|nr:hypothetical protein FQN57_005366 [Myotisia sp. PD_48]
MASSLKTQARSIYRSILRELPARPLSSPSPLKLSLRQDFAASAPNDNATRFHVEEAEQFAQYIQAQKQYISLLKRYNPGADMEEQERVRLSARRVGMNLPIPVEHGDKSGQ